ncbi:MAG: hypothetical protein EPN62_14480 [Candidimonas sp.]|nr:MAG: hypothetical protein EPN77_03830 [Candidimonas sp.]TAM21283.1 MAG: hypothetical protein EPN62_14480 [Candidimonas sp.]
MKTMTVEQLRAIYITGGVSGVTLKGHGNAFLIQITLCSGSDAVLANARSSEPRHFSNPVTALRVLWNLGISVGGFDTSDWNPGKEEKIAANSDRTNAIHKAHQAVAYTEWLSAEIQDSINDPRPSIPHEEVMAKMEAKIATLKSDHKPLLPRSRLNKARR